ncbi:MAG: MBL fold metallo-hydrolase [Candidatus Thermoplasmatota archaeon]|nr:MBL fold metallo-hydrolase [Candidatus Thermoplasmatota archaeon]
MKNEVSVRVITDGSFSLDPGAAFGVTPEPIWSRSFQRMANGRVKLALNTLLVSSGDISVLIDSGIGTHHEQKFAKIFNIEPDPCYIEKIKETVNPVNLRMIIHSHLHFDHAGNSFEKADGKKIFRNALIVAQDEEFRQLSRQNELTRGNYSSYASRIKGFQRLRVKGNLRLLPWISVLRTGGHTPGHQAIIIQTDKHEVIYPGDLFPTSFHLQPNHITAIDYNSFETLAAKKMIIKRALRKNSVLILNHDLRNPSVQLHGTAEKPEFEPVEV